MFANSTPFAIPFTVINFLAPRAEVLYGDQVRNVLLSGFGVLRILRGFKVVEYVEYSVAWWQQAFQWLHITLVATSQFALHTTQ